MKHARRACDPVLPNGKPWRPRDVVNSFIRDYRDHASEEAAYYANLPSFEDAIEKAAMCELPSGKRHPHQYRIPGRALRAAKRRLLRSRIHESTCFDGLHDAVAARIGGIRNIGPLTIYDIAHRVGVFLGLHPKRVFLHRGTREGARALGLGRGCPSIDISELPPDFNRLSAAEIEDCLCIYKKELLTIS